MTVILNAARIYSILLLLETFAYRWDVQAELIKRGSAYLDDSLHPKRVFVVYVFHKQNWIPRRYFMFSLLSVMCNFKVCSKYLRRRVDNIMKDGRFFKILTESNKVLPSECIINYIYHENLAVWHIHEIHK